MKEPGRTGRRELERKSKMEERRRRQLWKANDSEELGGIIRSNKERGNTALGSVTEKRGKTARDLGME